jgi:hypothetical protein
VASPPKISRRGPRNLSIRGNTLVRLRDNVLILDGGAESFAAAERGILLEHASGVEMDGLAVQTTIPGAHTAASEIAPRVTAGEAGVRVRDVRVPAGLATVQDLRVTTTVPTPATPTAAVEANRPRGRRSRRAEAAELASRVGPSR